MKVVDLKALAKEHGLRRYSRLKKAELITFLQNNLQPAPAPHARPPPQMSTWEPIDDRPKPIPSPNPRPIPALRPHPKPRPIPTLRTRPPPPPPP